MRYHIRDDQMRLLHGFVDNIRTGEADPALCKGTTPLSLRDSVEMFSASTRSHSQEHSQKEQQCKECDAPYVQTHQTI